jgi:hypothetical protein
MMVCRPKDTIWAKKSGIHSKQKQQSEGDVGMTDNEILNVGDVCTYSYDNTNKSLSVVEVVKYLSDECVVVKFHQVIVDDSGNGLFTYLCDKDKTMNVSKKYLCKIDLINRLKADKEALIAGQETLQKHIAEKDAEVERLQSRIIEQHNAICEIVKQTNSEAIKEFAERLKKEATVDEDSTWWIANIDVDNLVKELTEPKAETSVSLIDGHIDGKEFWNDTH